MRVGKKPTVVEAKKTRSCVVRLEKVPSPPSKMTRSGASPRSTSTHPQEEKKLKGPLKKRPVAQTASPSTASSTSVASTTGKTKEKEKLDKVKSTPQKAAKVKVATPVVVESPPPTIAAGRSRRAIKPNPKYASDDMVTPKIIKNVAILGASTQRRGGVIQEKQRKRSTNSSEDFYSKESSDELGGDLDESEEKSFGVVTKETDSDFSDVKVMTPVRKRGRPRRDESVAKDTNTGSVGQVTKAAASALKNTTSHLQMLRKTFAANMNRSTDAGGGLKRKRDAVGSNDSETILASKRLLLSSTVPTVKQKTTVREVRNLNMSDSALSLRKTCNSQTVNGSKIMQSSVSSRDELPGSVSERRKLANEIGSSDSHSAGINARPSPARLQSSTMSTKSPNARIAAGAKQRSASPATPKQSKAAEKCEDSEKKIDDSPTSVGDDFEMMPTFTIVNINDIINKKTDVLISKAKKSENVLDSSVATEAKPNRRKAAHATLLSEKADADRVKSPLPRTPFPVAKKPVQKILNHTLAKRTSPSANANQRIGSGGGKGNSGMSSTSPDKPAPRILNAMVAKKTQPVKPMIANPDDSADESYPLSLDDEEEVSGANEEDTFVGGKRKLPSSTPYPTKKSVPATKENSLAATNRLPTKPLQRKLSPERVVISRQGDKIIKKITCFETWYVINIPEDRPVKNVRNQLEIPLIKLANMANEIKLPSESWSSKVTLYKLSSTMIAKPNLTTYTGDLKEHNIAEEERSHYQPSCVMFRRAVNDRLKSRLPYDRAVIFKNRTFFTNIEGKNVKLVGAPVVINTPSEAEILLQIVDALTLQSSLVEPATTVQ